MRKGKKAKLDAAGWVVGSVKEFLGLSEADAVLIEMKLALSQSLRDRRKRQGLSQVQLAERLQSSQSRVAKMEAGDPSVSMDLLVSSLLQLGASSADLANAILQGGEKRTGPHAPSRMLKKSASFVLASFRPSTYWKDSWRSEWLKEFLRSPRFILGANGPHEVRYVPPRAFTRCGLAWAGRVSARRGWAGEKSGLFEHPAGVFSCCATRTDHRNSSVPKYFSAVC